MVSRVSSPMSSLIPRGAAFARRADFFAMISFLQPGR
jgi:hypothetical protein